MGMIITIMSKFQRRVALAALALVRRRQGRVGPALILLLTSGGLRV